MSVPKPRWFREGEVMVSTAPTCGISKSGGLLSYYDSVTGEKIENLDELSEGALEVVNDQLLKDMEALRDGRGTPTLHFINEKSVSLRLAVPSYYDRRYHQDFLDAMSEPEFEGFTSITLRSLVEGGYIQIGYGHGSAPKDLRAGEVPYIKVSDLRAGLVNINPTNRVPLQWAQKMWGADTSGLQAFDLLSPERASKNIGDFCVLMPGQESLLLTKEIIVIRVNPKVAHFDQFYLLWAMTLRIVRNQWNRVVFMQTNREDVGNRYLEIEIPTPPSRERADEVSAPLRRYFTILARERQMLQEYLGDGKHHLYVAGASNSGMEDMIDSIENVE